MILTVYRIIIGAMEYHGLETYMERGLRVRTKYEQRANQAIRRIRHSSFFYKGPQMYNLMPVEMRQFEEVENPGQIQVNQFKKKVDVFLEVVPDQPAVAELNQQREATLNTLICQVPVFKRNNPNYRLPLIE